MCKKMFGIFEKTLVGKMNFCDRIFLTWFENGDIYEMNFWLVEDINTYFFISYIYLSSNKK